MNVAEWYSYMIMRAVHAPYYLNEDADPSSVTTTPPGDDRFMPEGAMITWFVIEAVCIPQLKVDKFISCIDFS